MDSVGLEFIPYDGDLMGLAVNENHLVFRWNRPDCKVLFSVTRRGNAASCHFASDSNGLRHIKEGITAFVNYVFWLYDWCTMVIAQVSRPSVGRLIEKVGFIPFADCDEGTIYMRPKDELC